MDKSQFDWYTSFLIPKLKVKVDMCLAAGKNPDYKEDTEANFNKLNFHINYLTSVSGIVPGNWIRNMNYQGFNEFVAGETKILLDSLRTSFRMKSRLLSDEHDTLYKQILKRIGEEKFLNIRAKNYNERLADFVLNNLGSSRIYETDNKFIQKADPIFMAPGSRFGRAHFYAPYKQVGNLKIETMIFNMIVVWILILGLFVTLYYNLLKRFIAFLESLKLPILRKFGRELIQV